MRFSLILCTINRTNEVEEFLTSLEKQTFNNFEVIVVDQNKNNEVLNIVKKFELSLNIRHIFNEKGLSKSRNKGLCYAIGEIVCFPDDDCTYPDSLLENINSFFKENNYKLLMGKTIDPISKNIVAGKNILKSQELNCLNILGSSTTLFIEKKDIDIYFDERFGLGSIFNAEEENELIFRLLKNNYRGFYNPDINYVYHPPSDLDFSDFNRAKARAIGLGAFIAKHLFSKEGIIYFIKYNLFRPIIGSLLYTIKCNPIKSKYYFYRFLGVWIGFFKFLRYKNETNI